MNNKRGSLRDFQERLERNSPATLNVYTAQDDEQFEKDFEAVLEKILMGLEQDKKSLAELNEDGLSSIIVIALNAASLPASREKNSNGHVDLTIEATVGFRPRRKLGEAKIYRGPSYHFEGLEQLLGRYTTGRESRGLMIEYVKQADIAGLIRKIREAMDGERPMQQQGETQDNDLKWSFISVHRHSSGEDLAVGHYGCNLFSA